MIRELKAICKYMPHFVGSMVLITLAYEATMPSPTLTFVRVMVLSFGGIALMFSGLGGSFFDAYGDEYLDSDEYGNEH